MPITFPVTIDGSALEATPGAYDVTTRAGKGDYVTPNEMDDSLITLREAVNNLDGRIASSVDSVNGQTGTVVLDPDDLDDSLTTNKFVTATDLSKLSGIETGADVTDSTNVAAAGAIMENMVTTKGDMLVASAAATMERLPVSTDGYVLTLDSGQSVGVKWAAAPGSSGGIGNVSEDTTPELGGDLDTNGFDILFDSAKGIRDENDHGQLTFTTTASAVNNLNIKNAAAGNSPELKAEGTDTDISINLVPKGAGAVKSGGVDLVTTTGAQTLANKTIASPILDGAPVEEAYTITDGISVDLDPDNGTLQVWTLGANRVPTATNFANGQSMLLKVADGTAYTLDLATSMSVVWVGAAGSGGGSAPTLATSGYTMIELWKQGGTIYAALVGEVAS